MSARKAAKAHHRIREGKQSQAPEKPAAMPPFINQAANLLHQQATVDELNAEVKEAEAKVSVLEKELTAARNRANILQVDRDCETRRLAVMTSTHSQEAWDGLHSRSNDGPCKNPGF